MFGKKPKEELATLTKKRADLEKRLAALPTDSDDLDAQVRAETERGAIEAMLRAIDARITALGPPIAQEQDAAAMAKRERARQAACDKGDGALRKILSDVRDLQTALGDLSDARGAIIAAGGAGSGYAVPSLGPAIETFMLWLKWRHRELAGLSSEPTPRELAVWEAEIELANARAYLADFEASDYNLRMLARRRREVRILDAERRLKLARGEQVGDAGEHEERVANLLRGLSLPDY